MSARDESAALRELTQAYDALQTRYAIQYAEAADWEAKAVALREAGERLAACFGLDATTTTQRITAALAAWQRAADLRPFNTGGKHD